MSGRSIDTSVEESQTQAQTRRSNGEFVRGVSGFRSTLGDADFPAAPGRYHLFVAFNCPWCHRVTLARNVLGLQDGITLDVAFPGRTDEQDLVAPNLWEFNPERVATLTDATLPECTVDTATGEGYRLVKQIYAAEGSNEASVPILYDKKTKRIVNNESAEIIRMLNDTFRKSLSRYVQMDFRMRWQVWIYRYMDFGVWVNRVFYTVSAVTSLKDFLEPSLTSGCSVYH